MPPRVLVRHLTLMPALPQALPLLQVAQETHPGTQLWAPPLHRPCPL